MKADTFSINSWHARLATVYGPMYESRLVGEWADEDIDFCEYVRAVIRGAIYAMALAVLAGLVAWGVGDALAWLAAWAMQGYPDKPELPGALIIFLVGGGVALICFVGILFGIVTQFRKLKDQVWTKSKEVSKPSFLAEAYSSFKGKYCKRIRFE